MTGPREVTPTPTQSVRDGLHTTLKGRRRNEPGLEWATTTPPTVQEVIDFLSTKERTAHVRIGSEGNWRHIAVQS
jgi:hypothetical protein